ncbi:MAG: RtcB family protein [Myxococcales bacterium]|nr:RtcB family protein [Myxococcales bacterium]
MTLPRVVVTRGVPVLAWSSALRSDTAKQLTRLAEQPWVVHHVAAMPDAHVSEGVAVGSVFATRDVVVPGALGTDLGCGVSAVRFETAPRVDRRALEALLDAWTQRIPVGDEEHRRPLVDVPRTLFDAPLSTNELERTRARLVPRHLGTLGGGNHFVELDRAHDGTTWLLVHTGSRGLGGSIGHHHGRIAGKLGALSLDAPDGRAFWSDLSWALDFAKANRDAIMAQAIAAAREVLGLEPDDDSRLDLHHNFAQREEHFGEACVVHRKGAIHAPEGRLALIPGSMGTASYVVRGRGHAAAFASASHGAGRVMTRREARAHISRHHLERQLRGVVFDASRQHLVEEAPTAYRDVMEVLEDETDLVEPVLRLEPLVVLKG